MKKSKTLSLTSAAMIAALYVVLTYVSNALGLASGNIQIRLSEALTILPIFTPAAIGGLFIGCLLSNILTGCCLIDIILGSIATLLGAVGTRILRKKGLLAFLPPILSNAVIVPFVLRLGYGLTLPIPFMMLTVGIGEIISCGVLGFFVRRALKNNKHIF
jgi:uncharacterized membrane protein